MAFGEEQQILAPVAHDAFELERATPHEGTKVPDEGLGSAPPATGVRQELQMLAA